MSRVACVSVCFWNHCEPCKNGRTDRDTVCARQTRALANGTMHYFSVRDKKIGRKEVFKNDLFRVDYNSINQSINQSIAQTDTTWPIRLNDPCPARRCGLLLPLLYSNLFDVYVDVLKLSHAAVLAGFLSGEISCVNFTSFASHVTSYKLLTR